MAQQGPIPGQGQPAQFSFSFAGTMNPPNFTNNQFGGNQTGQAAQAGPHGGGNPFATAGANMPQFGGSGSFSFGGGKGGFGDSIKGLIKSNTDLITAIKDLTKAVKGGGVGDGPPGFGPGGTAGGGAGGGNGGGMGGSALDRQLLYGARGAFARQGRGGGGGTMAVSPFDRQRGAAAATGFSDRDNIQGMQALLTGNDPDFGATQAQADAFGRSFGPAFGRGVGLGPQPFDRVRGFFRGFTSTRASLGQHFFDQNAAAMTQASGHAHRLSARGASAASQGQAVGVQMGQQAASTQAQQAGAAAGQQFRQYLGQSVLHYGKQALRGGRDYGFRLGASTSVVDMAAATPFVGGALAAPLSTLQELGMKSAILELPSAVMSGFGLAGSAASGKGAITTHSGFINNMARTLGLDAAQSLSMGNNLLLQGGGGFTSNAELFGSFVSAFGQGFDPNMFAMNARMRTAGSNLTGTAFGNKRFMNAAAMAQSMGLKGVGATEFVQGVGGLGAQFRGMGVDLTKGLYSDISRLDASGFTSLEGLGAVEGVGRIRSKTTIAASQSLGGMFAGIGNDLLMAQAISEANGDLDKASARLENMSVQSGVSMLKRATGLSDGNPVFEMIQMGQTLTAPERRALQRRRRTRGSGYADVAGLGASAVGMPLTRDIDISAKLALDTNEMLETFQTGQTKAKVPFTEAFKELTEQNKAIEKKLIEGINVKDFDKIIKAAGEINDKLRYVPKIVDKLLEYLGL